MCSHDVVYGGLCVACGEEVAEDDDEKNDDYMLRQHNMNVRREVAQAEDRELEEETRQQKKLMLVLDLDNTLIHTSKEAQGGMFGELPRFNKEVHSFCLAGTRTLLHLKTRPLVGEFLAECSKIFRMYVYTHGTREYAAKVASIIDPDGKFFGGGSRILDRESFPAASKHDLKYLNGLLSCNDRSVIIVDDRTDVWSNSPNVLKVFPYEFFTKSRLEAGKAWWAAAYHHNQRQRKEWEERNKAGGGRKGVCGGGGVGESSSGTSAKGEGELRERASDSDCDDSDSGDEGDSGGGVGGGGGGEEPGGGGDGGSSSAKSKGDSGIMAAPPLKKAVKNQSAEKEAFKASPLPLDAAMEETEQHLGDMLKILKGVHVNFFKMEEQEDGSEPDVRHIMLQQRAEVLKGCTICFSGVHRQGTIAVEHTPHGQLAIAYGARCSEQVDEGRTTHLICITPTTSKYHAASKTDSVASVRLDWLLNSTWSWQRQKEGDFPVYDAGHDDATLNRMRQALLKAPLPIHPRPPPVSLSRSRKRPRSATPPDMAAPPPLRGPADMGPRGDGKGARFFTTSSVPMASASDPMCDPSMKPPPPDSEDAAAMMQGLVDDELMAELAEFDSSDDDDDDDNDGPHGNDGSDDDTALPQRDQGREGRSGSVFDNPGSPKSSNPSEEGENDDDDDFLEQLEEELGEGNDDNDDDEGEGSY